MVKKVVLSLEKAANADLMAVRLDNFANFVIDNIILKKIRIINFGFDQKMHIFDRVTSASISGSMSLINVKQKRGRIIYRR